MALGADRKNVLKLVLRGALQQTVLGLAIGIPVAIARTKLMGSQLYHVKVWDPATLFISVAMLLLCTLVAAVIPAKRAASIDPMKALRTE